MKFAIAKGSTSVILTVFIQDSSSVVAAGLAGLIHTSSIVGGYAKKDGTGVALAVDEDVTTEGTYQAPSTVAHVRIGTPANMINGIYELHFHNDLFTIADWVTITLGGATNMVPLLIEVQLTTVNLNAAVVPANLTQIDGAATNGNNASLKLKRLDIRNNTAANAFHIENTAAGNGMYVKGLGSSAGIYAEGGATAGAGITARGGTNGPGLNCVGVGAGKDIDTDEIDLILADTGELQTNQGNWLTATSVTVSDKTGFSLSVAGILAIWHQATAAIVSGIGLIFKTNVNATISSRATSAKQDTMETSLNAVKAKTDNLPVDPADASDLAALIAALPDIDEYTTLLQIVQADIKVLEVGGAYFKVYYIAGTTTELFRKAMLQKDGTAVSSLKHTTAQLIQ